MCMLVGYTVKLVEIRIEVIIFLARYILVSIQETRMIWSYIPIERAEIINTRRVIRVKI